MWFLKPLRIGYKEKSLGVFQGFMNNCQTILSYFNNRSTNASAEAFNAKVKDCRAPQLANTPASCSKQTARATPKGLRLLQRSTGPFADRSLCLLCAGSGHK